MFAEDCGQSWNFPMPKKGGGDFAGQKLGITRPWLESNESLHKYSLDSSLCRAKTPFCWARRSPSFYSENEIPTPTTVLGEYQDVALRLQTGVSWWPCTTQNEVWVFKNLGGKRPAKTWQTLESQVLWSMILRIPDISSLPQVLCQPKSLPPFFGQQEIPTTVLVKPSPFGAVSLFWNLPAFSRWTA